MSTFGHVESQIVLVRHGQTDWSRDGKHTGRTDLALNAQGRAEAALVGPTLRDWTFSHRFSSPLQRATETAALSGLRGPVTTDDDLMEWDYGVYEGLTNEEIQGRAPGWSKWTDALPDGEVVNAVGARADAAIDVISTAAQDGPAIVFAHGHFLAIFIARWLGLPASEGRRFVLETATASVVGTKRDDRVLRRFNHRCGGSHIAPSQD